MYRIAIHPDRVRVLDGSIQSFSDRWTELLEREGHEVRPVHWRTPGLIDTLRECDGFLTWFPPLPNPREYMKRLVLTLEQALPDLLVFPSWKSAWHFDDKIAQTILLEAAGLPMPRTHVFWHIDDARAFVASAQFPLVLKLASGFRSRNVALLRNAREAELWLRRFFAYGVSDLKLSPLRALRSKLRPSTQPSQLTFQKGVILLQEFVPDNAFDTRVVVIGHRAVALRRPNRPNDFRASGSGVMDPDPRKIDVDAVELAMRASRALDMPSIAVDVLRRDGKPVLTEVSYYFEGSSVLKCPGHWVERDGGIAWVEERIRAEDALLEMFLARLP
ncbi:MAG TPA: hypothetical protein VF608_15145 [Thermoanaerobaculia bacterium]